MITLKRGNEKKMTFEEIDEKTKNIKTGRKIVIRLKRKKTQTDESEFRIVSGKVIKVYPDFIQVFVKIKKIGYMECFLKKDLCRTENSFSM